MAWFGPPCARCRARFRRRRRCIARCGGEDALAALDARYEALLRRVAGLGDAQLSQPVVGRPYDVHAMLHGIIHHNVYHTGQIALLRDAGDSHAP
jgi:uncharacterized damage-inducible protein DinB